MPHDEAPPVVKSMQQTILEFNKLGLDLVGGDHYTGTCIVLFRGDYAAAESVKEFIRHLHEKPS